MKKRFVLMLIVIALLAVGCSKEEKASFDKKDDIEKAEKILEEIVKEKELSQEEKDKYISESKVMDYISEDINYNLEFVYLKGKETPEIIFTYNTEGIPVKWEARLFIFSYNEDENIWERILENDNGMIMGFAGVVKASDNKEVALYYAHSGGTAGYLGVNVIEYNSDKDSVEIDLIYETISYANVPEFIEEEETILYEGFSHDEFYRWNGNSFDHEILKIERNKDADIEIHFTIENEMVIFPDENMFISPLIVNKGDIITFVQDNTNGVFDKFFNGDGLEYVEENRNTFIVTDEGLLEFTMRVNYDWHSFELLSVGDNMADKPLTKEEFQIKTDNGSYLSLEDDIGKIMKLLNGGVKEAIGSSIHSEESILYSLKKDGIDCLYYDNPYGDIFINSFFVDQPQHSTFRGLRVGDSYDRMVELYNVSKESYSNNGDSTSYYYKGSTSHYYDSHDPNDYLGISITIDDKTNSVTSFNIYVVLL